MYMLTEFNENILVFEIFRGNISNKSCVGPILFPDPVYEIKINFG